MASSKVGEKLFKSVIVISSVWAAVVLFVGCFYSVGTAIEERLYKEFAESIRNGQIYCVNPTSGRLDKYTQAQYFLREPCQGPNEEQFLQEVNSLRSQSVSEALGIALVTILIGLGPLILSLAARRYYRWLVE